MDQNRWRSPVLWAAIVAQVLSILIMVGAIDVATSEAVNVVAAGVLQLLVLVGVMNNPENKDRW